MSNFAAYITSLRPESILWLIQQGFIRYDDSGAYQSTPAGDRYYNDCHGYFLDRIKTHYPFTCEAPLAIKPHHTQGKHASIKITDTTRLWGFALASERDDFVRTYPEARP